MPDFANMTEEEQIAFAMQMSMQDTRNYSEHKMTFSALLTFPHIQNCRFRNKQSVRKKTKRWMSTKITTTS